MSFQSNRGQVCSPYLVWGHSNHQEQHEPMHGLKLVVKEGSIAPERTAGIPSTSRTGQTRFARPWRMELQTSANQLESHWCTNAWHNHWIKWRWTPRTVTYASRLATAYWRSCPAKLRPSRHNPTGAWQFAWGIRSEERLGGNQPQSTPMVSQHSVEQTIYGTKARFRPTTTVGELRVSYHTENIPFLWGERQWYPPGCHGPYSRTSCHIAWECIPRGTPAVRTVPPQTGSLAQRAVEEWERNLCQNKAVESHAASATYSQRGKHVIGRA